MYSTVIVLGTYCHCKDGGYDHQEPLERQAGHFVPHCTASRDEIRAVSTLLQDKGEAYGEGNEYSTAR